MDKVYIVASGADHVINEVFDNREDAEKYVCFHRKNGYYDLRIQEYKVYKNAKLNKVKVYYGIDFIVRDNGINYFHIIYDYKPIKVNIEKYDCFGQKEYHGTLPLSNRDVFNDKDDVEKFVYDAVAKFNTEEAGIC